MNVQGMAEQVYLRYLQRWGKDYLRRRLDWTLDEDGGNPAAPRHLSQALCPCQYIEEILRNKEPKDTRACCPLCNNWLRRRGLDWPNRPNVWQVSYLSFTLHSEEQTTVPITYYLNCSARFHALCTSLLIII